MVGQVLLSLRGAAPLLRRLLQLGLPSLQEETQRTKTMTNAGPKPPLAEGHLGTFVCDITLDEFECWAGPDFVAASWWADGEPRYCVSALPTPNKREPSGHWKRIFERHAPESRRAGHRLGRAKRAYLEGQLETLLAQAESNF